MQRIAWALQRGTTSSSLQPISLGPHLQEPRKTLMQHSAPVPSVMPVWRSLSSQRRVTNGLSKTCSHVKGSQEHNVSPASGQPRSAQQSPPLTAASLHSSDPPPFGEQMHPVLVGVEQFDVKRGPASCASTSSASEPASGARASLHMAHDDATQVARSADVDVSPLQLEPVAQASIVASSLAQSSLPQQALTCV